MIGVDLVYIPRVKEMMNTRGEAFLERVFSPEERANLNLRPETLAGRFAAKRPWPRPWAWAFLKRDLKI